MRLSVVIPAYNEEKRISKTLEDIDKYLKNQNYDYEILVVNDGSKDKTVEVAESLIPRIKNLKVTGYKINQGKGYAVRFGMAEAKGDYRLFTDADNSTPIAEVEKMWPYFKGTCPEPIEGYDIIIGSRDIKGAVLSPPQPPIRRLTGEAFGFLTNLIVGTWGLADSQCGFKGFTKKAAEDIFPRCKINRFSFDPEFLAIAKKLGYKIKEIPIFWRNDLRSTVKFKSMVKMGIDLLKIRWNLITKKYD